MKENRRKVLYLAPEKGLTINQSGGAGTHMRGTIQGFRENGFIVLPIIAGDVLNSKVVVKNMDGDGGKSVNIVGRVRNQIKHILPDRLRLLYRDVRTVVTGCRFEHKVKDRIRKFNPDFIYERSAYLSNFGGRLAKELGVPHFLETDGCMVEIISDNYGVFSRRIGNSIEKRKLNSADFIVVLNKFIIPSITSKFNLQGREFLVKPLGIEVDCLQINLSRAASLKKKLGVDGKRVIGFVGAVSSYHGVSYLIEACKILPESYRDRVAIVIVGWSKEAERLLEETRLAGITNVVFVGKVNKLDVKDYYHIMDVGIVPDCEETLYPIKVLEYGAFRLCPLVPDYAVMRDIISERETGFFFRPRDKFSLCQAIVRIADADRDLMSIVGQKWNDVVAVSFQWKQTVGQIAEVLSNKFSTDKVDKRS